MDFHGDRLFPFFDPKRQKNFKHESFDEKISPNFEGYLQTFVSSIFGSFLNQKYSYHYFIFLNIFFFIFREVLSHSNVTFNDNGTVSTLPKHPLVWDEERSKGNREDDLFILPNIALLVSSFLQMVSVFEFVHITLKMCGIQFNLTGKHLVWDILLKLCKEHGYSLNTYFEKIQNNKLLLTYF